MQRTDWRFTLTRDIDTFIVSPEGFFQGSFKDSRDDGQLFFRRDYQGELSFRGGDYSYIKARYDAGNYCDIYELLIERKVSGIFQVYWMGFFSLTDGKFDFEKCRYYVKPTVQDKYSCIINNWETEFNVLDEGGINISGKAASILEFELYGSIDCNQPADSPRKSKMKFFYCIQDDTYLYAREAILLTRNETPSGTGWIEETDFSTFRQAEYTPILTPDENQKKWVREWDLSGVTITEPNGVLRITDIESECETIIRTPSDLGYTEKWFRLSSKRNRSLCGGRNNGGKLGSSFAWWIRVSDYSGILYSGKKNIYKSINLENVISSLYAYSCNNINLQSAFLQNTTNPVTLIPSKTDKLYLIQKSDAKRPNASNPATVGMLSFKTLMESLYTMFQLYWYISDDTLFIVHQNEVNNVLGLDITADPYVKFTAHQKAIDFDKTLLYRFEKWTFAEAGGADFIGTQIEYPENCSYKGKDSKTKTYDSSKITTDLAYIQINADKVSDDGFVMIATDGSDVLLEDGLITGATQLNGHLSLSNLHYNYWRHNRILSSGLMNGIQTAFLSTQKIRKLPDITIQYCGDFDPLKRITTELGIGEVNEAEYFPLDNKQVLNLSI